MYSIQLLTGARPISEGHGLNDHGDFAGFTSAAGGDPNPDPIEAAIWFSDNSSYFTPPSTSVAYLNGINNSGHAVGALGVDDGFHALLIKSGEIIDLSRRAENATMAQEAHAINNQGRACAEVLPLTKCTA